MRNDHTETGGRQGIRSTVQTIAVGAVASMFAVFAAVGDLRAKSLDDNAFFIGHSLVAFDIPAMTQYFVKQVGGTGRADVQITNGAPLRWNWEHADLAEGLNALNALPTGAYDAVIMTEAVPLQWHVSSGNSARFGAEFYNLAIGANPDTRVYLYETWHDIRSGTGVDVEWDELDHIPWRERIQQDLALWLSVVDGINDQRPEGAPAMQLIPVGQGLGRLSDAIDAGQVPGLDSIADLFADSIHLNDMGEYFVALMQTGAVYDIDPKDLPVVALASWDKRVNVPSDMAEAMQDIAARTLAEFRQIQESSARPAPKAGDAAAPQIQQAVATEPPPALGDSIPVLGMGLSAIRDYDTQDPFIDLMKSSREWIGHIEWWGGMTHDDLQAAGFLDEDGWLTGVPEGIRAVESQLMVDLPTEAVSFVGTYRIAYKGTGLIDLRGGSNVVRRDGEIWFDRSADDQRIGILIVETDPNGTSDYIRDITVVRERHLEMFEAGVVFNPEWIDRISDLRLVRFMDWMQTNGSLQSEWKDRPKIDDVTWAHHGVPLEILVRLANEIGADPWFNIPHLATDDFITAFAAYVRDNLDPRLKAHVEYSNEIWNDQFSQTLWAKDRANSLWGAADNTTWMEFVGLRAAEISRIWRATFGDAAERRLVNVIGVHTGWLGLEVPLLFAPRWVAKDPQTNTPPVSDFDAYAITGYFGPLGGDKADMVRGWIAESLSAAGDAATDLDLSGGLARARYIETHRYDLAVEKAISELRRDEVATLTERYFPYHAKVARENGLDLIMYEGGSHVVGRGPNIDDQALTDFFTHFNYTAEIAQIYETIFDAWQANGGTVFNAFVDVSRIGKYGSWGHLRHLADGNPRWNAVMTYNATRAAWWNTRGKEVFAQGLRQIGTETADKLVGSTEEDILIGRGGDDVLIADGGGDYLHGGSGYDTARLAGSASDYTIERQADGLLVAKNGIQTIRLRDIERLIFEVEPDISVLTDGI